MLLLQTFTSVGVFFVLEIMEKERDNLTYHGFFPFSDIEKFAII